MSCEQKCLVDTNTVNERKPTPDSGATEQNFEIKICKH